jgi:polysaccharide biosynthesis/export protein
MSRLLSRCCPELSEAARPKIQLNSFNHMKHRFPAVILLCGAAVCLSQASFTTPLNPDDQGSSRSDKERSKTPVPGIYTGLPSLNPDQQNENSAQQNAAPVMPSMRAARPQLNKSEFQQFAEDTAGRSLPVYGREVFDQVPTTFAPADQVPVPSDYIIGPGDEILIRIWGKVALDGHFTVDRNGQISLPKVGTLNVAGLRSSQLEDRIRSAVNNLYRDFEINVTLGRLRSIQIYVLGSARQPGTYTVSSLSTLLNALFASGGPSASGSLRHIQLRRGNQAITDLDLYRVLRDGDKSQDVQLLPGDVIYIPPTGPQVAIFGSVKEPGIYELGPDEQVSALLHSAGGLTALADAQKAIVEHIRDHRARSVEEFALDQPGMNRPIQDGDLLRVLPLSPQFENAVTLRGSVARPARYSWRPGMRVSDLIPNRDALISRDYWNQKNHVIAPDSLRPFSGSASTQLREKVAAGAQTESEFRSNDLAAQGLRQRPVATSQTQSDQAIDQPNNERQLYSTFNPDETPTIATVGKISAEINWEYAVVERLDPRDLSTHLIPFRLASAIDDPASSSNQVLMAGDVVTIFSRTDLELPMEKHAIFVRVGGEVNAPGIYRVNPGDTLQDAVRLSGGLTSHSYLYASRFTRTSVKHAEEDQLRQSSEQMQRDLMARYVRATPTQGQTGADQEAELTRQRAAIAELSSIKPTGRVVLQIQPTAAALEDIPVLPLEDGDTFYVPPRLSTVQVAGAVYNANAFRFQPGMRLSDYLNSAGGPTREADKKRVFVIRADGAVISKQASGSHFRGRFENLKLLPGDAIVVPQKLRGPGSKALQDTVQIISQSALTAAALSAVIP